MRITQKNERGHRAFTPQDFITLSVPWMRSFDPGLTQIPHQATFLRVPSCYSWPKKLGTVRKCKLRPETPQETGVYCEEVRISFVGESAFYGVQCSRARGRSGSSRRFSGAGREDLSHHRDVQGSSPGPGIGGTRYAAPAAADGRPRGRAGKASPRNGAAEERARGYSQPRGKNAIPDRVAGGGQLAARIPGH